MFAFLQNELRPFVCQILCLYLARKWTQKSDSGSDGGAGRLLSCPSPFLASSVCVHRCMNEGVNGWVVPGCKALWAAKIGKERPPFACTFIQHLHRFCSDSEQSKSLSRWAHAAETCRQIIILRNSRFYHSNNNFYPEVPGVCFVLSKYGNSYNNRILQPWPVYTWTRAWTGNKTDATFWPPHVCLIIVTANVDTYSFWLKK